LGGSLVGGSLLFLMVLAGGSALNSGVVLVAATGFFA